VKKSLPVLLLAVILLSGCSLFNIKDRMAVEKTINEMNGPMSSEDASHFPSSFNEDTTSKEAEPTESPWYGAEFKVDPWQRKIEKVNVNGTTATAYVSWKLPITATVTISGQTKSVDLSLAGEGEYTLTKNSDDSWQVTDYPRFQWNNAYGPKISNITFRAGTPASLSATIPVVETAYPIVSAVGYSPLYVTNMVKETENPTTFTANPLPIGIPKPGTKHQGVITVLTIPTESNSIKYGITVCYFETTTL